MLDPTASPSFVVPGRVPGVDALFSTPSENVNADGYQANVLA
jgi:hypothetical protein